MSKRRVHWTIVSTCTIAVLVRETAAQEPYTIRDSAAVRIVESRAPLWTPGDAWRVAESPNVSLSLTLTSEHANDIASVRGLVALPDGQIAAAVWTRDAPDVRCFRPDGTLIGRVGESALADVNSLHAFGGDSLLVSDLRQRRVAVLDRACRMVRQWELPRPDDASVIGVGEVAGVARDRTVIVTVSQPHTGSGPTELVRHPMHLFRHDAADARLVPLGSVPGLEYFEGMGVLAFRRLPFARESFVAVSDNGYVTATNDTYEIRRSTLDGKLTAIVRRTVTPQSIPPDRHPEYRAALRQLFSEERRRRFSGMPDTTLHRIVVSQDSLTDRIPFPPTFPLYAGLLVDREGYLWVRAYEPTLEETPSSRVWSVFDPQGRWLGDITLPGGFQLYRVSGAEVLGLYRQGEGIPYVWAFRLLNRAADR